MKNLINDLLKNANTNGYENIQAFTAAFLILDNYDSAIDELNMLSKIPGCEDEAAEWLERLYKIINK